MSIQLPHAASDACQIYWLIKNSALPRSYQPYFYWDFLQALIRYGGVESPHIRQRAFSCSLDEIKSSNACKSLGLSLTELIGLDELDNIVASRRVDLFISRQLLRLCKSVDSRKSIRHGMLRSLCSINTIPAPKSFNTNKVLRDSFFSQTLDVRRILCGDISGYPVVASGEDAFSRATGH
jgi:hypothetical protein